MIAQRKRDTIVIAQCRMCGKETSLAVNKEDLAKYKSGEGYVQDLFPYLTPSEREMFIFRTCGECWDKLFPPEEE